MQPQGPYDPAQPQGQPLQGQPQSPYGPPGSTISPGGQPVGPVPYGQPGGQPGQVPYPGAVPGQPGQMPQPGQPGQPGQFVQPGQVPPTVAQPAIPGQPSVTPYQMPAHLQANQQSTLTPTPAPATTPYDFFMDAPKPLPPSNPLPLKGRHLGNLPTANVAVDSNSKKKFFLFGGVGLAAVLVLFMIPLLVPEDPARQQMFGIAQTQQEIVRVCNDGVKRSKLRATRNFAITCATGVATNQKELLGYMSKTGLEFNSKELGQKQSGETDSKLAAAKSSTTYDATFRTLMLSQLNAYDRSLTSQLGITTGENGRAVLSKSQQANTLLLQMIKDDSDKTEASTAPN